VEAFGFMDVLVELVTVSLKYISGDRKAEASKDVFGEKEKGDPGRALDTFFMVCCFYDAEILGRVFKVRAKNSLTVRNQRDCSASFKESQ
jgi:hypothetical protein